MPVIVIVSPKGGVGKTTSALVLADQLARQTQVTVIDADPNKPVAMWAAGGAKPDNLRVVSDADEENIIDKIEEAAAQTPFVIVDLEGTAAKIVILAVSQADLIVIPMQGSQLDASQASRALKVVQQQEKMSRRKVPYGVLLTRTSPIIRTKTMKHLTASFESAGINLFTTELNEREAYKAMFSFAVPLGDLDPKEVSNLDKAITNAEEFASEVIAKLREGMAQSQQVA
ncbi:chromosome partitioning protein ParA [Burkholderia pseudomultivorans]|uniref:ParA family protein n=1 Tax=Burkholderia pseudomultivorans TaxID=1207504 RepID=UPI000754C74C|nr:ParA family protein [Burkholderia pseudomultivorans]AOI94149.1 chromosome partitioning protein ParA [Burkholderia pseudomultivorans]KVC27772.1 chromosome partitioning protein ParA [Burkholderia pseudomultivorans]KVC36894.1 chromosome partitioning protein ParA [Burkholderia pseudomultivorans]KVC42135.1 chromosome partitioning protein ParA [Burkholderia pseudomultivorans]